MAQSEQLELALGERIRSLRIRARLTQIDLADRANISVGALKHLETGAGSSVATLVKVLRALGEEGWIDQLGPGPAPFNPLEVLDARRRGAPKSAPRRRVRHPRRDAS